MNYVSYQTSYPVYSTEQIRQLEQIAIQQLNIESYELMTRAGQAAFTLLRERYPEARKLLVITGSGNNGGDGYVVARLALQAGLSCHVVALKAGHELHGDAATARQAYIACDHALEDNSPQNFSDYDLIIDAILGTGIKRAPSDEFASIIHSINESDTPVISLDVPSGLQADSGNVPTTAVKANHCITFVGLKSGLLTAKARDYIGSLILDTLDIPTQCFDENPALGSTIDDTLRHQLLPPRAATSYKNQHGHVLVIGGNRGYPNAARLAAEAAARAGAGLVSVLTHPTSVSAIAAGCASLMVTGTEDTNALNKLLQKADVIVIGPGLGQDDWAKRMFARVIEAPQPTILDADALYWLSRNPCSKPDWILTPHSGEAARLLSCTTADIEVNRISAAEAIHEQYQGVAVLKGAGTLVCSDTGLQFCTTGNSSLATGGTGDVLAGIIAALVAQGAPLSHASACGVHLHGRASEIISTQGTRGLLASDLFAPLHSLVNPQVS